MIGSTRAGRRAEQFAALVDDHVAGELGESRRTTGREPSAELVALASVVGSLRDLDPPEMRPEFARSLRNRLMLEAPERLAEVAASTVRDSGRTPSATASTPPRLRLARIAAVTCVVVGITGGVAAASQSALPGDPLYDVKRGIERAQVSLAGSDATEGERLVSQAGTRLDEVNDLAVSRPDDPETIRLIQQTLDEFSDQADDGAAALITSYQDDSVEQSIVTLRHFADTSSRDLDQLGSVIPNQARAQLLDAAQLLSDLDQEARDVCANCSALAPLHVSDTVQQLARNAEAILDLPPTDIPDNDPGGTSSPRPRDGDQPKPDDSPAQEPPSGLLPSLPALTQVLPPADSPDQPGSGTGGGKPNGGAGQGTTRPPQLLPDLPLPDLPLPSLPLLGDIGGLLGGQGQQ